MFDPFIGRWMQDDPDGFAAGDMNLYRFVGNNPVNQTDPTGLDPNVNVDPVFAPKTGNYGAFVWPIKWSLNKGAGSGIIMQRIDVKEEINQTRGGTTTAVPWGVKIGTESGQIFQHWYETWEVTNGEVDERYLSAPLKPTMNNKAFMKVIDEDFPAKDKVDSKGIRRPVPVFSQQETECQAHDWFIGADTGRQLPDFAKKIDKTWGYIYVTAQARFYPGMTLADLKNSGFKPASGGRSGSIALYSFAWPSDAPDAEANALKSLKDKGQIFGPESQWINFQDFKDFQPDDLTTRHFLVYWDSKGATTILQGTEAEDTDLAELMKKLKP